MSYLDIGDSELIYLIRCGNQDAKETLFNRYRKRIFGIVDCFVKKNQLKNPNYQDLFSESFIVFLKCLDNYNEEYNFYIYIENSIERMLFKLIKKENLYYKTIELDENISNWYVVNDSKVTYQESELRELLNTAFDDTDKKIMDLKTQGYTYSEIAGKLNLSIKSIYKRVKKIKDKFRNIKYIDDI